MKRKETRREKIVKIRAYDNEIENRQETDNEHKAWLLYKVKQSYQLIIGSLPARLIQKQRKHNLPILKIKRGIPHYRSYCN
jgi:hypothetical protein